MRTLPILIIAATQVITNAQSVTYPIVDTDQTKFYDNASEISEPSIDNSFYGQDANYVGNQPSYTDNGDGTITDNVTGLMWEKGFSRSSFEDAQSYASSATTGGYSDWRVPTTKELYSLINFNGNQGYGNPSATTPPDDAVPFIDTNYFDFEYPNDGSHRYIDAQYIASTEYSGTVMEGQDAFFGVNFADGRIKGYPQSDIRDDWYLKLVRGNENYGVNNFTDNGDNTITDNSTGLMWTKFDSGNDEFESLLSNYTYSDGSLNWEEALDFAENLVYAGYDDWRLPNSKELQSLIDYSRSPDATNSAAINQIFETSQIINEAGQNDYPAFWSSTTFEPGRDATVIFFGRALGYMNFGNGYQFYDVHGAGAQRTDPKTGEPTYGFGPQGDVRRVFNYVRLVRDADITTDIDQNDNDKTTSFNLQQNYPNPFNPTTTISYSVETQHAVSLLVYDILGKEVATLVDETKEPGSYSVTFDASNLAGGIYFYQLKSGNNTQTKKMILIK